MNHKKLLLAGAAATLALSACKPHLDTNSGVANSGSVDFRRYIAVGNSLTAGYADGTLYRSGQLNSYPAILAKQFAMVGGGDFKQPLLNSESGYPGVKRVLGPSADCLGVTSLGPVFYTGSRADTAGDGNNIGPSTQYNNLGVPGIRAIDFLAPGYAVIAKTFLGAPYAYRFFDNPATDRPLDVVRRSNPTFFTAWIGNNDVLLFATQGGTSSPIGLSSTPAFAAAADSVISTLTANGAKGAVMNIPDVTSVPFFTTVPYNGLTLTRQGQVDSLNFAYQATGISFTLGANPFIIQDNNVPVIKFRRAQPGELILLSVPQDSLKCGGWGSRKPIPGQYVLDAGEIASIRNSVVQFNNILKTEAATHGLAFVDMNNYLREISSGGAQFNGVTFTTTFVRGGTFSLDGVHLTPRGYALAANEIIRNINATYGASVPLADVNAYNGLIFP